MTRKITLESATRLTPVRTFQTDYPIIKAAITDSGSRTAALLRGRTNDMNACHVIVWDHEGRVIDNIRPRHRAVGELSLEFWPDDNHLLLTGVNDEASNQDFFNHLITWEIGSPDLRLLFGRNSFSTSAVAISNDRRLRAVQLRHEIVITELSTGNEIYRCFADPTDAKLIFSPNGGYLAYNSQPHVYLIRLTDMYVVKLPRDPHSLLNFSSDSRFVLTAEYVSDQLVLHPIQTPETGTIRIRAGSGSVSAASFLPDSDLVVIGSDNGEIQLLNSENNEVLKRLPSQNGRITNILFSDSRHTMVTAGGHSIVKWKIN